MSARRPLEVVRSALGGALDLVLPGTCAACGAPGAPLCGPCRTGVREAVVPAGPVAGAPVPCWSAVRLDGPVRAAVSAYKDGGRRDLGSELAPLLGAAVARALAEDPTLRRARVRDGVLVVPVPPSGPARRRRGDDPVGALAHRAVRHLDDPAVVVAEVLGHTRRVVDQAGLGRRERAANLAGALAVRRGRGPALAGAACLVVDDVHTTGATLHEASRALRHAGARHAVGATLAVRARDLTTTALVAHRTGG